MALYYPFMRSIVTYETQHGSAKKAAQIIAEKLGTKAINVDTPFEAEDASKYDTLVCVFGFRGPYVAQLTKLFLERISGQMKEKNLVLVGVGLFSEKEFPVVADEIKKLCPSKGYSKYFIKGQLRVATLTPEEQVLLGEFSRLTGMKITDMGEFDADAAKKAADTIASEEFVSPAEVKERTAWICPVCGYIHYGDEPPETCPKCKIPGERFIKKS